MSLVKIQGNASGTGIFTIASPNSNTNRTLTLPDSTGTIATTADLPASSYIGTQGQVFTSSGTFTVPAGITAVKVTVIGGGGSGGNSTGSNSASGGGGGGGVAVKYVTGLTPLSTVTVTVGGAALTSSFGTECSATGGATAPTISTTTGSGAGGAGGVGSSGTINITGSSGQTGSAGNYGGAGGGSSGSAVYILPDSLGNYQGTPGRGFLIGDGALGQTADAAGFAATGYGNGGGGSKAAGTTDRAGGAGSAGIVIVEF